MNRISPNFIYAFILTRSSLELLHLIFPHLYESYGPWSSQNFVSAQYLENKLTEFHQILYMHSYWQDLAWDCYMSVFLHLYQSYGPWFTLKFCFRSISWDQIDRISPNFIYAFTLTKSSIGLIHLILFTFVPELWPLMYVKIYFPLNILRTNWHIFTKFYKCCWYWQTLAWHCYTSFFQNLYQRNGPLFTPKFHFCSIS